MSPPNELPPKSPSTPAIVWVGRALTALPLFGLTASAAMKVSQSPELVEGFIRYGYSPAAIVPIGLLELACVLLCLVPQTAVFGTILATAYLGGAAATHVSAQEAFVAPVVVAVLLWTGIGLRDARLRALLPLRRS